MPRTRPKTIKKPKQKGMARLFGRPVKSGPKSSARRRASDETAAEILRTRAEAEVAIADARKSHERLREAIEILPQGIALPG